LRLGHVTLVDSTRTSLMKPVILFTIEATSPSIRSGKALQKSTSNPPNLPNTSAMLAGVEGFEPPTPGFGVRCSSRWSYTPADTRSPPLLSRGALPCLLVSRMRAAVPAVLSVFQTVGMFTLVLCRNVIPSLALAARQYDLVSHDSPALLRIYDGP
jgi:hypothetical protein